MLEPLAGRILAKQSGSRHAPAEGARAPRPAGSSATSRGACWVNTTRSSRRTTRGCCTSSARTWPRSSSGSSLPPRDFRLWIAVHEVTHRVQFGAAPWLRESHPRAGGSVPRHDLPRVEATSASQIRRAIDEARAGADVRGMGGLFLLLNDEQREIVRHVQGVMSLLEGHASFVMNEVAKDHVSDLARMRNGAGGAAAAGGRDGAVLPASDRLRQEDRAVRRGRAVRPRGGVALGHGGLQPRVARARRPPDRRGDRRARPPGSRASPGADMPRRPPAVARVLERVTKTAREHEMFRPGDLVLVSCSGGPGLGLPALFAVAPPAAVQDPARRLPLRSPAPARFRRRTRAYVRTVAGRLCGSRSISGRPTTSHRRGCPWKRGRPRLERCARPTTSDA